MSQKQGGALPSSQGGLTVFHDEDTGFKISPEVVMTIGFLTAAFFMVI